MTRRVLVSHVDLRFGGVERQLSYLLRVLTASGTWQTDLLLTSASGEMASLVPEGVEVFETGGVASAAMRMAWSVGNMVRAQTYDAVLSMHPYVGWATALGLLATGTKVPLILSFPGVVQRGRLGAIRRLLCGRATAIHAVSSEVAASVKKAYRPSCPVTMIPNAVDAMAVRAASGGGSVAAGMREQGFGPVICTMGRLVPGKGVDTVIRALAEVRQIAPAGLVVIGDGPDLQGLRTLADSLGMAEAVRFAGFRPQPFEELAGADLFAFGSESEGLPSVMLEAACASLPIVTTRYAGGFGEFLEDGVSVSAVPIGDSSAMAAAIAVLHADPVSASRLGRAAEAAARPYDVSEVGARFLELLDAVASSTSDGLG